MKVLSRAAGPEAVRGREGAIWFFEDETGPPQAPPEAPAGGGKIFGPFWTSERPNSLQISSAPPPGPACTSSTLYRHRYSDRLARKVHARTLDYGDSETSFEGHSRFWHFFSAPAAP